MFVSPFGLVKNMAHWFRETTIVYYSFAAKQPQCAVFLDATGASAQKATEAASLLRNSGVSF
jgi:hypothetical protein